MTRNIELETDKLSTEDIDELCRQLPTDTCNGASFAYLDEINGDAVVKNGQVGSYEHCWVYDPDLDVTIDLTLAQFSCGGDEGVWDGDNHPYEDGWEEVLEWTDYGEFCEFWRAETENPPFHL
ncbi:hypothetical protein [Haloarcula rubripromontorii]|uniref:hypothetical protein n=1 Tax=Haloarcula rubripromontorii TaxID=1705562 RepID=UPI00345BF50F